MSLRDLLLHIDTYPDPTSPEAIDQAVRFAGVMGGTLSAVAVEVIVEAPNNRLANYLIGLDKIAKNEEKKSRDYCMSTLEDFNNKAGSAGVFGESIHVRSPLYDVGASVAYQSRTRDACLVPVIDQYDGQRAVIEAVVFGSGRPVLTYRPGTSDLPAATPDLVVLAWDGTRTAARAMADSLPLLQKARKVRVLTVTGEKPSATAGLGNDAQRHLVGHGVNAVVDEIDAGGKAIGSVFDGYLERLNPDLLVMGAYGQSRAREFILGGATEHMLKSPPVPLMLSH
jgi:nucleotide-binding universal stress UspA family protein